MNGGRNEDHASYRRTAGVGSSGDHSLLSEERTRGSHVFHKRLSYGVIGFSLERQALLAVIRFLEAFGLLYDGGRHNGAASVYLNLIYGFLLRSGHLEGTSPSTEARCECSGVFEGLPLRQHSADLDTYCQYHEGG